MQNSMWKFATLLGVIGVACLVIMQVQKSLPQQNANAAASTDLKPAGQAVPAPQNADPFAGLGDTDTAFTVDQFEPGDDPAGEITMASYEETPAKTAAAPVGDFGGFDDDFSAAPIQSEPALSPTGMAQAEPTPDFDDDLFGDAPAESSTNQRIQDAETPPNPANDHLFGDTFDSSETVSKTAADTARYDQREPGLFDPRPEEEDPFRNEGLPAAPQDLPDTDVAFGNEPYDPATTAAGRTRMDLNAPVLPDPNPVPVPERTSEPDPWASDDPIRKTVAQDAEPIEPEPISVTDDWANEAPINPTTFPDTREYQSREPDPLRVDPVSATPAYDGGYDSETRTVPEIRATSGARFQKSYDSVPHGTLRPQLRIEKTAPTSASIGKPLVYSILIKNVGNAVANEVIVEDQIPRGAKLTGTIPQAELVEGILVWRFESLEPQEQKEVKIRVVPEREGQIGSVATVNFKAEIGSRTTVTAPRLRLELQGSSEARVGDTVEFRYRVINEGSGDATNVWIRSPLPAQLNHPMGRDLEYEVGSLPAGKSREVTLQLVAAGPGQITNSAVVTAEGIAPQDAKAPLNILGAQLQVARRGPPRRYLNREAVYENTVTNTTHRDAENATLVEYVPDGMKLIEVNNDGQYNEIKRTITWPIRRIRAGQSQKFTVVLSPERAGSHESIVQIVETGGFKSRATSTTDVVHLDNMGLQLSELDGPVEVGEKVVFTINVRNRGTSTATNSVLTLEVPPELQVAEAGPTQAQQNGNLLVFPPVSAIRPGGQERFQVAFTASRMARDVRLRASIKSNQMPKPLNTEESITIYEQQGRSRR